ncbi:MAG: M23 family metallopeptidase [Anaerolineae bacterium]|nr:M23 family metallopeptidase [Anaerolineae bacterium]
MRPTLTRLIFLIGLSAALIAASSPAAPRAAAQPGADCGIVDTISYPIEDSRRRGDDFGIYRGKFGGLHTGVDVAFYRYGDPVYAIAAGRVTYANPEGWDTEKGVVIIEHTFPDGSVFYSLYGHMQPIGDYFFPGIGQCINAGDIVGAVGSPTLSAPHLHFEIRDFGPDDGGPGYWDTNPLLAGWEHPLDFIRRWQVRLFANGGQTPYLSSVSAVNEPSVPPVITPEGGLVMAGANVLEGVGPAGDLRWRMELSGTVAGMAQLPDGRVIVRTTSGTSTTISLLYDGRYTAVWTPEHALANGPFLMENGLVVFVTAENALAGYTPEGALRWLTAPLGDRLGEISTDGRRIAVGTNPRDDTIPPAWHVIGAEGQMLYQVAPANPVYAVLNPAGDAYLLDGAMLYHVSSDYAPAPIARLPFSAGRSTALAADPAGNVYVFLGLDESLLTSYAPDGSLRWSVTLPGEHPQPPLMAAGAGIPFYALAVDGTLFALENSSGAVLGATQLYSGGTNGQPNARLLHITAGSEHVQFGAGYLTVATLDGCALAGLPPEACGLPGE